MLEAPDPAARELEGHIVGRRTAADDTGEDEGAETGINDEPRG